MRLMVTMCKYISVLYVDINQFAIVVVHNGPLKKKKKKKNTSSHVQDTCKTHPEQYVRHEDNSNESYLDWM